MKTSEKIIWIMVILFFIGLTYYGCYLGDTTHWAVTAAVNIALGIVGLICSIFCFINQLD